MSTPDGNPVDSAGFSFYPNVSLQYLGMDPQTPANPSLLGGAKLVQSDGPMQTLTFLKDQHTLANRSQVVLNPSMPPLETNHQASVRLSDWQGQAPTPSRLISTNPTATLGTSSGGAAATLPIQLESRVVSMPNQQHHPAYLNQLRAPVATGPPQNQPKLQPEMKQLFGVLQNGPHPGGAHPSQSPMSFPRQGLPPGQTYAQPPQMGSSHHRMILPGGLKRPAVQQGGMNAGVWGGIQSDLSLGQPGLGGGRNSDGGLLARGMIGGLGANQYMAGLGAPQLEKGMTQFQGPSGLMSDAFNPSAAGKTGSKRRPSQQPNGGRSSKKKRAAGQAQTQAADAQIAQNEKAKSMFSGIQPRIGPTLTTQANLDSDAVRRISMSLLSGVPAAVNMALNSLSVLSYHGMSITSADEGRIIAALCHVIGRGLNGQKTHMTPEPRKPLTLDKNWWWDEVLGLFAEKDATKETLNWGICAANVLRNIALGGKNGQMGSFVPFGPRVVKCLEAREREPCPAHNELVLNVVEAVAVIGGKVDVVSEKSSCDPLVMMLSKLFGDRNAPLRLRIAAAGAIMSLMENTNYKKSIIPVISSPGSSFNEGLRSMLQSPEEMAKEAVEDEVQGELGFVDLVMPAPMNPLDKEVFVWRLRADAVACAAKMCENLCRLRDPDGAEVVTRNSPIMRGILNLATAQKIRSLLARKGTMGDSHHPFAISARNSLRKAERSAVNVVTFIASMPKYSPYLRPYEPELIEIAFSNTMQSSLMARILAMIQKNCPDVDPVKAS
ncbi:hypothetical protein BSKO_13067 [Bryopsis sp. KO-2023]|nr:hypothetical protein BSKO_13067 [Bryopsis sp. KO-2023]